MLKKYFLPVLFLCSAWLSVALPGCKPREEELQTSGSLAFSADTVKFDTVFTKLRTVTRRLWVYNRNPKAVNVDLISLDNSATSPYKLLINGDLKQTATGVYIRGNDSLLILVRAEPKDNGLNGAAKAYVLEEKLNFRTNGQDQHVLLRSFGQNIYLHNNAPLACGEVWRNDRPHVLYGTVRVPANCTLTIKPGARIYAHAGAALLVQGRLLVNAPADYSPGTGATDTVKATNADIVRFSGDRSGEAQYATAPGQWTGIVLMPGSQGNIIRYAQIQNAAIGVLLYNPDNAAQPDVTIQNTVIRYISGNDASFAGVTSTLGNGAGVYNIQGKATLTNTLLNDCYEYAVLGQGGSTALNFCTIANYAATGGVRKTRSLTFTNVVKNSRGVTTTQAPTVSVQNSIVWGAIENELFFDQYDAYKGSVSIQNSLLKTFDYAAATDAANQPGLGNAAYKNLINKEPLFIKPLGSGFGDYRLGATSPARKVAGPVGTVPERDLLNLPRTLTTPSLGAYESTK
jgi:hypothetical protein